MEEFTLNKMSNGLLFAETVKLRFIFLMSNCIYFLMSI